MKRKISGRKNNIFIDMVHNMFPKRSDFGESADMLIAEFSLIFIAVVFLPRKKQTTIGSGYRDRS